MKLATLQELFLERNPNGFLDRGKGETYLVRYSTTGKAYSYRSTSVYELAERFEFIPADDIITIAERVSDRLNDGAESVVDLLGAGDTINGLAMAGGFVATEILSEVDEYDRAMARYTIDAENPWL